MEKFKNQQQSHFQVCARTLADQANLGSYQNWRLILEAMASHQINKR